MKAFPLITLLSLDYTLTLKTREKREREKERSARERSEIVEREMRNILKKFRHHDSHRSNNETPASSSSSALSPSSNSDHRLNSGQTSGNFPASPSSASPSTVHVSAASPASTTLVSDNSTNNNRSDFFSSEEDFQVQLAIAISNSELRNDQEKNQFGGNRFDSERSKGEADAESLSRQYWVSFS